MRALAALGYAWFLVCWCVNAENVGKWKYLKTKVRVRGRKARPGHAQAVGRGPVETEKEAKKLRTLSRKDMIQ